MNTLPVLDWNIAIERASGSEDFAKELLEMLKTSLVDSKTQLEKHYAAEDAEKIRDEAHKLRGASSYCGTPRLTEAAKNLELAIKNQAPYETEYQTLLAEIQLVQEA